MKRKITNDAGKRLFWLSEQQKLVVECWQLGADPYWLVPLATYGRWTKADAESWIRDAKSRGATSPNLGLSDVLDLGECLVVPATPLRDIFVALDDENKWERMAALLNLEKRHCRRLLGADSWTTGGGTRQTISLLVQYDRAAKIAEEFGIDPNRIGV